MVSLCIFDSTNQLVPIETVKGWPARLVKRLFSQVKEISELSELGGQQVWIAGSTIGDKDWELLGVFETELRAVVVCHKEQDFVAQVVINAELTVEMELPGQYYPLAPNSIATNEVKPARPT